MNLISALIASFALSFIMTPLFIALGWRFKVLDYPKADKVHSDPTPLLGGVSIFLTFFFFIILFSDKVTGVYRYLFLSGAILFVSGLIDDIRPVSALKRLLIQILASSILIYGGAYFTFLPNTPWGNIGEVALTFLWLVGITNAFNYLDGLNGLASGVGIINAFFFMVFALLTSQPVLAFVLVVFMGSSAGFFPYNFLKGRIFLGNSGSAWMGYTLAGLAVIGEWALKSPVDLVIPILIFGVPIYDMMNTTAVRILDKKATNMIDLLAYRGKDHFHHRLSQTGLGRQGAVFFIYVISIMLGLNGLLLQMSQGAANIVIILAISTLFFVLISSLIIPKPKHKKREVRK